MRADDLALIDAALIAARESERCRVIVEVDRIIGAIATAHWINSTTAEAQDHKRMVRELVLALATPSRSVTETGEQR